MNVAILGGSFNPPHICHVFLTQYVLATAAIEQLWFLPCYRHAFGKDLTSFEHRFAMCSLAVSTFREESVKVLPLEQERRGTSWTIDTVRYLKQAFPDIVFHWIIGSDVLYELERWKDFAQLQKMISFVVVPRAGEPPTPQQPRHKFAHRHEASLHAPHQTLRQLKAQCDELERQGIQFPNVSSSLIRSRLERRLPVHHLVPRPVMNYITEHRLYLS